MSEIEWTGETWGPRAGRAKESEGAGARAEFDWDERTLSAEVVEGARGVLHGDRLDLERLSALLRGATLLEPELEEWVTRYVCGEMLARHPSALGIILERGVREEERWQARVVEFEALLEEAVDAQHKDAFRTFYISSMGARTMEEIDAAKIGSMCRKLRGMDVGTRSEYVEEHLALARKKQESAAAEVRRG